MCSHCPFTLTPFFNRLKRSTNKYGSINLHPGNLMSGESTFGWNKLLPLRLGNICKVYCWLWLMLWLKVGTHLVTCWYKTLQQQITFFAQVGQQVARNITATNHLVYRRMFVKNFVSATEFSCCNKSQKFNLIWFWDTCCSDKILLPRQTVWQKFSSTY